MGTLYFRSYLIYQAFVFMSSDVFERQLMFHKNRSRQFTSFLHLNWPRVLLAPPHVVKVAVAFTCQWTPWEWWTTEVTLSWQSLSHRMLHCDRKRIAGQTEKAGEIQVVVCCKVSAFTDHYLIFLVARKNIHFMLQTDIDGDTFQIWDVLSWSNQNFAHFMFFTMF